MVREGGVVGRSGLRGVLRGDDPHRVATVLAQGAGDLRDGGRRRRPRRVQHGLHGLEHRARLLLGEVVARELNLALGPFPRDPAALVARADRVQAQFRVLTVLPEHGIHRAVGVDGRHRGELLPQGQAREDLAQRRGDPLRRSLQRLVVQFPTHLPGLVLDVPAVVAATGTTPHGHLRVREREIGGVVVRGAHLVLHGITHGEVLELVQLELGGALPRDVVLAFDLDLLGDHGAPCVERAAALVGSRGALLSTIVLQSSQARRRFNTSSRFSAAGSCSPASTASLRDVERAAGRSGTRRGSGSLRSTTGACV